MKTIVAGIVCVVLLVVLCISGLVMSMSGGGNSKPPAAPAGQPAPATKTQAAPASQPAPAKPTPSRAAPTKAPPVAPPGDPNFAIMPDVVGLNAAVAEEELDKVGLKSLKFVSGDPRYRFVLMVKNWTVTQQSTPAGTRVEKTTLITLTCVKP